MEVVVAVQSDTLLRALSPRVQLKRRVSARRGGSAWEGASFEP